MNLLKLLLKITVIAVLVFVAIAVSGKMKRQKQIEAIARDAPNWSEAGFYLLQRDVPKNQKVWVMAPPNCPSQEAQQARLLCAAIQVAGVPCEISSQLQLNPDSPEEAERLKKFMDQVANPLVVVRGWGKGNPTVKEVIAQYRATK